MMPRYSDSDSSVEGELALRERRTLIDFPGALDREDDDSDSELNLEERNAEVTFDDSLAFADENASETAAMTPSGKSKTWANRLLRRTRSKPANVEKKNHTLGHFKTPGFSKNRPESANKQKEPKEHRHFHLKRNRPTKQEAKPAAEPLPRYRLCPYALPSLQEVHAHFGSELSSWNALPKADLDDRNSKFSAVIAMHFHELSEVARTVNGSPRNRDANPDRRPSKPIVEPPSPVRRNSDPAKPETVSAIEQAKMEMRHSEVHWSDQSPYSRSLPNSTPSGFMFASLNDPLIVTLEETDDDLDSHRDSQHNSRQNSRQESRDNDLDGLEEPGRTSDMRWSLRTPPPNKGKSMDATEDAASSPPHTATPASTKTSRFRKLAQFRSKHTDEKAAAALDDSTPGLPRTYSLAELQSKGSNLPGVDAMHKEDSLTDEEFERIFKCTRAHFKALPQWRRTMLKKEHGLF